MTDIAKITVSRPPAIRRVIVIRISSGWSIYRLQSSRRDIAIENWRRKRDSNPRASYPANGFQDRRFQPLTHSSAFNLANCGPDAQCSGFRSVSHCLFKPRGFEMPGYYHQEDLARFAEIGKDAPELWKKFSDWYGAVFAEGALTEREKALIALAVAHAVQCPYCIDAYTQASLEKGSNIEQMSEAVHVAAAIRGGASLVHGVQMRNAASKVSM